MMRLFTRRTAAPVSRSSRLTVQQLETRITPALTLHKSAAHPHGTLLARVDIQSVHTGAGWTNDKDTFDTIRHLEAFTKFIPSASAGDLGMLTKAKYGVGTGKSEARFIDSTVNIAGSTVGDAQIQSELRSLITAGKWRQPNSNRLCQVFVAPNETMIRPKNAVPHGYPIGGPLASVTKGLVSAFTPESIGFNSWRSRPRGASWLVADATHNQCLSD